MVINVPLSDYRYLNIEKYNSQSGFLQGIYYNGYIYTVSDNGLLDYTGGAHKRDFGSILKIKYNDFTDTKNIIIRGNSETDTSKLITFERIIRINNYLYTFATPGSNSYIIQYNLLDDTYKTFKFQSVVYGTFTDGDYLYVCTSSIIYKIEPLDLQDPNWPKFNIENYDYNQVAIQLPITYVDTYDASVTGSTSKGFATNGISDDNYIYLIFNTSGNANLHEMHKLDKSTLSNVGIVTIPTSSQSISQNDNYIFLSTELASTNTASSTLGYNWGAFAVRKSDLQIFAQGNYVTNVQGSAKWSYGVSLYGNYLLDYKTDYITYISDVSNCETWTTGVTSFIDSYNVTINNAALSGNSYLFKQSVLLLDDIGEIISLLYRGGTNNSGIIKYYLTGYDFTPPIIVTNSATTVGQSTTLSGDITNTGSTSLTKCGFKWWKDNNTDLINNISVNTGTSITTIITGLTSGDYSYYSYASNYNGDSNIDIESFTITGNDQAPSISILSSTVDSYNKIVTIKGRIDNDNGGAVQTVGVRCGITGNTLNNITTIPYNYYVFNITITGLTFPTGLTDGTYYFQVFTTNVYGEGTSDIETFVLTRNITINIPPVNYLSTIASGAINIHGSLYYNGFIYGSTRNVVAGGSSYPCAIFKIKEDDYTAITAITFTYASSGDTSILQNMDQIRRVGNYIYGNCNVYNLATNVLIQLDTRTDTYKVFKLSGVANTQPIEADDQYIYITSASDCRKFLSSDFESPDWPQYNVTPYTGSTGVNVNPVATYTHTNYGEKTGGVFPSYDSSVKGTLHAACQDNEYLYLAFTTGSDTLNRYEVHKVLKSDMSHVGWVRIPRATDDMDQTDTHLYFGCEVQPGATSAIYGYGWGVFAVKKSELFSYPILSSTNSDPIIITTITGHTLQNGNSIVIEDHLLNTNANRMWVVCGVTSDSFSLSYAISPWLYVGGTTTGGTSGIFQVINQNAVLGLPRYDSNDDPPNTTSYGVKIYENYLLDLRTNKYLYITDISDVDNWNTGLTVSKYLINAVGFKYYGNNLTDESTAKVPNEILIDENGYIHNFLWKIQSGVMKYKIPLYYNFASNSISSGYTINIKWNTVGTERIGVNFDGSFGPSIYNVNVKPLVYPGITGTTSVYSGNTYSYSTVSGMTNYSWLATGGTITGVSTGNTVNVLWNPSTIWDGYVSGITLLSYTSGGTAATGVFSLYSNFNHSIVTDLEKTYVSPSLNINLLG